MNQVMSSPEYKKMLSTGSGLFTLGVALFLLLIVSSVSIVLAAKIVVILLLQIFTGKEFYSLFVKSRSISVVEVASVGFSLGALIWLLSDQLFIALSLPHVGWLLPVVIAVISHLRVRANTNRSKTLILPDPETVMWVATNGPTRVRTTQFGASLMRLTIPVHE